MGEEATADYADIADSFGSRNESQESQREVAGAVIRLSLCRRDFVVNYSAARRSDTAWPVVLWLSASTAGNSAGRKSVTTLTGHFGSGVS